MPDNAQNVRLLHPQTRSAGGRRVPLERLGVAVWQLADLGRCIERIVRDAQWSALDWRVACTPLMLRLPEAQHSLADLAGIDADRWSDAGWAVRLRAEHDEVERQLLSISRSMRSLIHEETSSRDTVADFSFAGTKLANAVADLCCLVANRYPEAVDNI